MRDKVTGLIKMFIFGMIIGVACTCVLYRFFPQYLCYAVYDVGGDRLSDIENREVNPGTGLTEYFTPNHVFLTGIIVNAQRQDSEDVIECRLFNSRRKLLAEDMFTLRDPSYEFRFNKWVTPGETYQLEITLPESNTGAIITTFGTAEIGTSEHISSYMDDVQTQDTLYIQYVYGTYSRKLLAFWFLMFFLGGIMIWDTKTFVRRMHDEKMER